MREAGVQVERLLQDLIGVRRNHVDTRELLGGLDEEPDSNAVKGPRLAAFEQFFV